MSNHFPPSAARRAGRAAISVKANHRATTAAGTQPDSLRPRGVENEAMRAIAAQAEAASLRALHVRLMELERIAAQPYAYPHEYQRPARPLYGPARWRWIGARVGLHWREVQLWLDDADRVLAARIAAGLGW